jgi:hypothetical protein
MARSRKQHHRSSKHRHSRRCRHGRSRRLRMKGGAAYSSAASFGEYVNGSGSAQYNRVFDQAGPYGQVQGNVLIGAQGQNVPPASQMPNASQLALVQGGGRRKTKKGGFLGVVNEAIVPLSLAALAIKNKPPRNRTRSHRRH